MEIRQLAERVLYGARVEDKLVQVGRVSALTDAAPGRAVASPRAPGRPGALALDAPAPRARVPFPSIYALDQPEARGVVLHFFANHELLAMELMALCLLKFPDADPGFRRGVMGTLVEEQRHLGHYLSRMEACGVEFGHVPVNRYFWDCIATMETPLDFVARMSLTFEQANLDYASYYAEAFRIIGDDATADVLDVVLADEIGHVAHGLAWFDRWRPGQGLTRFEAYHEALGSPLSPRRARGKVFYAAPRREAGLDDAYIDALRAFGASKGRPPGVFWFNPSCEDEAATGHARTPTRAVRELTEDLELVPLALAGSDDVVLTRRAPSRAVLLAVSEAFGDAPAQAIEVGDAGVLPAARVPHAHLGALRPWGHTAAAARWLAPLAPRLIAPPPPPPAPSLYAKTTGARLLASLLASMDPRDAAWWCPPEVCGRAVETLDALDDALERIHAMGYPTAVVKAPFGASGRGATRLRAGTDDRAQAAAWLARVLSRQGALVVEPWLDRCWDVSFLLHIRRDATCRLTGTTRFFTDPSGVYQGSLLGRPNLGLPRDLRRWLTDSGHDPARLRRAADRVAEHVGHALIQAGHVGPAGVDALAYRDPAGRLRFKPIVEVNPRTTMGHVALALSKRLAPDARGLFALARRRAVDAQHGSGARFAAWLRQHAPLRTARAASHTAIASGALTLTDPATAHHAIAMLVVGPDLPALAALIPGFDPAHAVWSAA